MRVAQVGAEAGGLAAGRLDFLAERLGPVARAVVVQREPVAAPRQRGREGTAQAAPRAGDEGDGARGAVAQTGVPVTGRMWPVSADACGLARYRMLDVSWSSST